MMKSQNQGSTYEQISFNKQCPTGQESIQVKDDSLESSSNIQGIQNIDNLLKKVAKLEHQLKKQKQKSSQLEKRNQQLTDMLVSASQSNVKRNEHFIREIQRKICNFKASKDLSSSTFKPLNATLKETDYKIRITTEGNFDNARKSSSIYKEEFSSRGKLQSNKQNRNLINQRLPTDSQKVPKQMMKNQSFSPLNDKMKKKLTYNENQKINHQIEMRNILSTKNLSVDGKMKDMRIFSKLQNKMMRT